MTLQLGVRCLAGIAWLSMATALLPPALRAADPAFLPKLDEFEIERLDGGTFDEKALADKRATLLLFLGHECPVSNGYAPTYLRFAEKYGPKGLAVVGVYPDPNLSADDARTHANEYRLTFPLALDAEQALAKAIGITVVPEAAILDAQGNVLYRGRVDDRYSLSGRRKLEATTHDLKNAVEAVLAGERPDPATTEAFGCRLPQAIPTQ